MARRKGAGTGDGTIAAKGVSSRSRVAVAQESDDGLEGQPQKRRRRARKSTDVADDNFGSAKSSDEERLGNGSVAEDPPAATANSTPGSKRRGRPRLNANQDQANGDAMTPSAQRKIRGLVTPSKGKERDGAGTPSRANVADRSARRKSARALIDRVVTGATSDDEAGDEDLEREIYESSESEGDGEREDGEQDGEDDGQVPNDATTPSKTPRGRKKRQTTRKKSPTPPPDLPPHEQYFYQNRPGARKTSNNTLANVRLLTHDEYFSIMREHKDHHDEDVQFLQSLHARSFPQWAFELSQGFSICLYGYGSKRPLLHQFARYLHDQARARAQDDDRGSSTNTKIIVINGYVKNITTREVLTNIAAALDPGEKLPAGNPVSMTQAVLALLTSSTTSLTIIINSIDAPPLRKPVAQSLLARIAAHPATRLICSADTPDAPLLWDSGQRAQFSFAFHDATTFAPFAAAELDVVDEVHALLGRRARRAGSREGVGFVLRSLPENARALFRLLVGEVLAAAEDDGGDGEQTAVEYRMVYNKAVEEFICSSEMAFRTLLKEFHDHQMITSRKDVIGTELLGLPFQKDELEAILEDLMD